MSILLQKFQAAQHRKAPLPDIRPGDTVRVYERIKEGDNDRTQIFEGLVIARRHGSEPGASIAVRKISYGVGVERTFPLHSPLVEKIEIIQRSKVRRAKLFYMRGRRGRAARVQGERHEDVFDLTASDEPSVPEEGVAETPSESIPTENETSRTGIETEAVDDTKEKSEETN